MVLAQEIVSRMGPHLRHLRNTVERMYVAAMNGSTYHQVFFPHCTQPLVRLLCCFLSKVNAVMISAPTRPAWVYSLLSHGRYTRFENVEHILL